MVALILFSENRTSLSCEPHEPTETKFRDRDKPVGKKASTSSEDMLIFAKLMRLA